MKLLLLLCIVFAVSGINAYVAEIANIIKLTQKMNKYITDCIAEGEFDLTEDDVSEIFSNEKDIEKEGMEQVTRCFFHKAGILEPDGALNIDSAKKILTLIGLQEDEADALVEKCGSITGFDAKETAYAIFKCVDETARS